MRQSAGSRISNRARQCGVAAASLILLATAAKADDEPRTFRDWMAGCDNIKTCVALSLPADDSDPVAYLRFERPAGMEGAAKLVLKLRSDAGKLPAVLQLKLDGAPFPAQGRAIPAVTDNDSITLTFAPGDIAALLEAARKARNLTIGATGLTASVSLAGSVAAMLWIDEQQGRLGTTSALIRRGTNTAVPPAPNLPIVSVTTTKDKLPETEAKKLIAALRKHVGKLEAEDCSEDEMAEVVDEAWPLGDGKRLVGLLCSRGAYSSSSSYWIVQGNAVEKAAPAVFPQGAGKHRNLLTDGDFDPETGQLGFFAKGRGLADCGVAASYAWSGTGFVQTDLSMMGECRGIMPEDWITLYRSRTN